MLGFVFGFVSVLVLLAVVALPVGLSALALVWVTRRWVPSPVARALAAVAFTIGPGYQMWRMEWYDVWRYGVPPISFIVTAYAPYLAGFAALGWWLASWLLRSQSTSVRSH